MINDGPPVAYPQGARGTCPPDFRPGTVIQKLPPLFLTSLGLPAYTRKKGSSTAIKLAPRMHQNLLFWFAPPPLFIRPCCPPNDVEIILKSGLVYKSDFQAVLQNMHRNISEINTTKFSSAEPQLGVKSPRSLTSNSASSGQSTYDASNVAAKSTHFMFDFINKMNV